MSSDPDDPSSAVTRQAPAFGGHADASGADLGSAPTGGGFELDIDEVPRVVTIDTEEPIFVDGPGRYEDGALLGSGGMGSVHLKRDRRIGRSVAMKVLHFAAGNQPELRHRFLREARIQGQLEHPAIPPVYEIGRDDGRLWFTMRRVRGLTLARILHLLQKRDRDATFRFPRQRLLHAFVTVCDALHYAHSRGVVHRDLKPANIMLGEFGEVWVLDWGLARLVDEMVKEAAAEERRSFVHPDPSRLVGLPSLTKPGNVVGTVHYMAPEQVRGEKIDGRADVYSLGVILYEILTLTRFREDGDYIRVLAQIADGRVARPSEIDASIDPRLDSITAQATAIGKDDRFQTAAALRGALLAL